MKCALTDGNGKVWLEELPIPRPGEYECLCKNLVWATCTGTDKKIIHGGMPGALPYPGILGHESVGTVVETGAKVRNFRCGDMVIRPTAAYPGTSFHGVGSVWGGFAEYGLVTDQAALLADSPDASLNGYWQYQLKIPDDLGLDPADAVQLITLKEVTGYAASVGVGLNTPTLLLGAGPVSFAFCRAVKLLGGYPLMVAARRDEPLAEARKRGADFGINTARENLPEAVREITCGSGAFRIIDISGSAQFAAAALPALAEGGRICHYAALRAEPGVSIPEEKTLSGQTGEVATHGYFCSLLRHGMVKLNDLYSHRLPARVVAVGFDMLERNEAFKIVFDVS